MRLRQTEPIIIREVNYMALREAIEDTFAYEYGPEAVRYVRIHHFNPDMIDVTVFVQAEQPGMYDLGIELGEELDRQGLQVGFLVKEDD